MASERGQSRQLSCVSTASFAITVSHGGNSASCISAVGSFRHTSSTLFSYRSPGRSKTSQTSARVQNQTCPFQIQKAGISSAFLRLGEGHGQPCAFPAELPPAHFPGLGGRDTRVLPPFSLVLGPMVTPVTGCLEILGFSTGRWHLPKSHRSKVSRALSRTPHRERCQGQIRGGNAALC